MAWVHQHTLFAVARCEGNRRPSLLWWLTTTQHSAGPQASEPPASAPAVDSRAAIEPVPPVQTASPNIVAPTQALALLPHSGTLCCAPRCQNFLKSSSADRSGASSCSRRAVVVCAQLRHNGQTMLTQLFPLPPLAYDAIQYLRRTAAAAAPMVDVARRYVQSREIPPALRCRTRVRMSCALSQRMVPAVEVHSLSETICSVFLQSSSRSKREMKCFSSCYESQN